MYVDCMNGSVNGESIEGNWLNNGMKGNMVKWNERIDAGSVKDG